MQMCGKYDKVELPTPQFMKERPYWKKKRATIEVDRCCAKVLEHLWSHSIDTQFHCCGHGGHIPYIMLAMFCTVQLSYIEKLIREVDPRAWRITQ